MKKATILVAIFLSFFQMTKAGQVGTSGGVTYPCIFYHPFYHEWVLGISVDYTTSAGVINSDFMIYDYATTEVLKQSTDVIFSMPTSSGNTSCGGTAQYIYLCFSFANHPNMLAAIMANISASAPVIFKYDYNCFTLGTPAPNPWPIKCNREATLCEKWSPPIIEDACIAHFNYTIDTKKITNDVATITFDDDKDPNLLGSVTNILNTSSIYCGNIFATPKCLGIGKKTFRVTDSWSFDGGINWMSCNSISNPTLYDATGIDLNSFEWYFDMLSPGPYISVCHKKTIEIGCYYEYGKGCEEFNSFYSSSTIYDCEVCEEICFPKATVGQIIAPIQGKSSQKIDLQQLNDVLVYPNPASHELFIKGISGNTNFEILNLNGEIVLKNSLEKISEQVRLDVSSLKEGTYILRIRQEGKSDISRPVIISK